MATEPTRAIDPWAVALAQGQMLNGAEEKRARQVLESLCDPTRLRILRALLRTPLAASDLAQVIGRSRSGTSQHLRVLRDVRAVMPERRGNVVRYRIAEGLNAEVLAEICKVFDKLAA